MKRQLYESIIEVKTYVLNHPGVGKSKIAHDCRLSLYKTENILDVLCDYGFITEDRVHRRRGYYLVT